MKRLLVLALFVMSFGCDAQEIRKWAVDTKNMLTELGEPSGYFAEMIFARRGQLICGVYGNGFKDGHGKIDSAPFYGKVNGKVAHVFYRNGYTGEENSIGTATVTLGSKKAVWATKVEPAGEHYFGGQAEFERVAISRKETKEWKANCGKYWGLLSNVDLKKREQVEQFLQTADRAEK
jgi:hypothetical protein